CWAPGGWNSWHTGPRWVNAPPGFRAPVPPAAGTIVVGGSPGRVVRPGTPWDRGGLGRGSSRPAAGGENREADRPGVSRGNRRVLTNDDVQARVPRTDTPAAQPQSPGANDADRRPKTIAQPPASERTDRFRGERESPRTPVVTGPDGHSALPAERSHISNPPPVSAPPSQPVRQFTPPPQPAPPVHQFVPPPAPAPMHQSPPPAAAVQRQ